VIDYNLNMVIGVYKPRGISSNAALARLRQLLGEKKIGHAGTLDPLAEGVLVVGIGPGTKKLAHEVVKRKVYLATIRLGVTSTTDDTEGELTEITAPVMPKREEVVRVLEELTKTKEQVPPKYSAIKIRGREAYKRVRRGEKIEMKPRSIVIYSIELIDYVWPLVTIRVNTSPGVYIRSLARDMGYALGTGGILEKLIREAVGEFTTDSALTLDEVAAWYTAQKQV
jgi:tRNA pseudouridine55 synthase